MYGGPDLSTFDPNPTLYSYGDTSTADQVSQIGNVVGQWGTAIASIVTGNPVATVSTPQGVQTIGARGSTFGSTTQFAGNSGLILIAIAVVALVLILKDK